MILLRMIRALAVRRPLTQNLGATPKPAVLYPWVRYFKIQCTTQRAYSKRDLFKSLISMNMARDHHNRIIHRFIEL